MEYLIVLVMLVTTLIPSVVEGGCAWPTAFKDLTWLDNTRGTLVFANSTMTGWAYRASDGSTISSWECFDDSSFSSLGTLIMKATTDFTYSSAVFSTYVCLKMTTVVADTSYYYYQDHDVQVNANYERVRIFPNGTTVTSGEVCESASIPVSEFHFLVKSSSESSAKQYCPPALLAKMDYTHTAADSTVTCDTSADNWDVCTDRMVMTFNYGTCVTVMAYSTIGTVYCMMNITSTDQFVVVYNTDASPTYKFACIASNSAGTAATMVYKNCTSGMTSSAVPADASGAAIGASLTMTATETCPFIGPNDGASPGDPSGFPIFAIIGAVVGILVIIAIIVVTCYIIKRKKKAQVTANEKPKIPDKDIVVPNGTTMAVTDVNESTAQRNQLFEVNPPRNTLTPIPQQGGSLDSPSSQQPPKLPPIKKSFTPKA